MTRSAAPDFRSAVIWGPPFELNFTLFPVAFSNIGSSVPNTPGRGPPPATTVISAACAGAPATSALKQPAIVMAMSLNQAFMTTSMDEGLHSAVVRQRTLLEGRIKKSGNSSGGV